MAEEEIDAYLATLDEPKRSTLTSLRRTILEIMPDAGQGILYGMPAFRVQGHVIAGFAAFKNHLSYFPHSGSVVPEILSTQRLSAHFVSYRCNDEADHDVGNAEGVGLLVESLVHEGAHDDSSNESDDGALLLAHVTSLSALPIVVCAALS